MSIPAASISAMRRSPRSRMRYSESIMPPQALEAGIIRRAVFEHFLIKREEFRADPSFLGGNAPIRPSPAAACCHNSLPRCRGSLSRRQPNEFKPYSFNNLVGRRKERLRHRKSQPPCDRKIESELKFGRLLNRQVAWFGAFQDLIDIHCRVATHLHLIGSDRHQRARIEGLF